MYRLLSLSALLMIIINSADADPRTPRIYNVLISSKKNLSPSHAVPVYEPVLRTTPLGFALPPYFYQPTFETYQPVYQQPNYLAGSPQQSEGPSRKSPPAGGVEQNNDQTGNDDRQPGIQPLPVHQFIPYNPYIGGYQPQPFLNANSNNPEGYYSQAAGQQEPQDSAPAGVVRGGQLPEKFYSRTDESSRDPKNTIANLKRNPEIPDVPPPALPVRKA